jgi:hypothetical protein
MVLIGAASSADIPGSIAASVGERR